MGNPRNLRRASSQEEDEGDVFDEKSDISSGSETEEEAAAQAVPASTRIPTAAAAETSAVATDASPPASSASKDEANEPNQGPLPAAATDAQASSEPSGEAENEKQRTEQANVEYSRHRRNGPGAEGARQRPKSTWQLMQEDPSYVPRATRYFLHDDRREGDSEESDGSEGGSGSQPDDSVPQSTQTRVGPSKKPWTPDENKGMWKHDMWELLQKEEAGERPPGGGWSRGRYYGRRGGTTLGYRRGGRGDSWVPRGSRGGRTGYSDRGSPDDSWRGGWRPSRGRGRGQNWGSDQRKQYVPKQTQKQTAEAA